jgi:hypothetical protein
VRNRRGPATVTGAKASHDDTVSHWERHRRTWEGAALIPEARRPDSDQPIQPSEKGWPHMPFRFLCRSGSALACALAALTLIPAAAAAAPAKSGPADLRVVDSSEATLAEHTQYTAETTVKARPEADCFGEGTGGSGDKATVAGRTALGAVIDAADWDRDLRPVLVTDHFDFGLGVCGFGDAIAPMTGFWYLKINHVASQVGGDQASVRRSDEVLWYLVEDFNQPVPVELELVAPARTTEETVEVQVWEYADNGTRSPAAGATVTGALQPTDAEGRTTVAIAAAGPALEDPAFADLRATREGAIPSNEETVCRSSVAARCPASAPTVLRGTDGRDKIKGTDGPDQIKPGDGRDRVSAGDGDDRIDVRGGGADLVRCGSGDDEVKANGRDVLKGCG